MSKSANIFDDVLDHLPDMCFLLSPYGAIHNVNKAAISQMGIESRKIIGRRFTDFVHPQNSDAIMTVIQSALDGEGQRVIEGKWIFSSDSISETLFVFSRFKPTKNEREPKILAVLKDISTTKKENLDLQRLFYVAENTVNPLQITDEHGNMIYVNPAFVKMSGYTKNELNGKNPRIFGSGKHSKDFWKNVWKNISNGKAWQGEVINRKKSGQTIHTQLMISPIVDDNKGVIGYFGIHQDLTDKRKLEKQLVHTQKMESIGTLAAGVAHEVGNPLASISALVQILQRTIDDDFSKEKLELVKKQVNRISKIIRDLVDFSRPSNYELQPTDINENLKEAIEIVRVGKKAKKIQFVYEPDEEIPLLHVIPDQVQQVFVNILINAVDAMSDEDKNEQPTGEIKAVSYKDQDNIYVEISDTGPGIPEDHLSKIFEPFFTTKKEGKGTGLGLWVSYGIIKSFHGKIKASNRISKGTTFTMSFPVNPLY